MQQEPKHLWQLARRPEVRTILWVLSIGGVIGSILIITLLTALAANEPPWEWLKALILPAVIASLGTLGGAWFTRQRARDTALQAYLDKMSELLIDKHIHREFRRYADTRVTARARTLAVLSQLDGKGKRTVLLFLREARLISKQQYVREGRVIYPRLVGLRGADLSKARLRGAQLVSTDRKEAISLEEAMLRGADLRDADLRGADLRGADLRGADLRGADLRGAILSEVDWGVSREIRERANLRGPTSDEQKASPQSRSPKRPEMKQLIFQITFGHLKHGANVAMSA
jgi:hypothetical protein